MQILKNKLERFFLFYNKTNNNDFKNNKIKKNYSLKMSSFYSFFFIGITFYDDFDKIAPCYNAFHI